MKTTARDLFARFRRAKPQPDPMDRAVTFNDLYRIAYETAHFDGDDRNMPDPLMESMIAVVCAQAEGRQPVGRRRDWMGARRAVTWAELRRVIGSAARRGGSRPANVAEVMNIMQDGCFEVLAGRSEPLA